MSVDLCENGFFARLTRDGDFVTVRLLSREPSAGGEPEVVAAFRCGLDELASVLADYTLQLSNERGDFLLVSPRAEGFHVAFTVGDRSRGCVVTREAFEKLIAGLNAKL